MKILFLPKLLPRADVIGGPILIYHRVKNLHRMGHRITVLAPAYDEKDRMDRSLNRFCEEVIKVPSSRERCLEEVERLRRKFRRPRTFFVGDGAYDERIEEAFRNLMRSREFDAVIAEYTMMGQYLEANREIIPRGTLSVVSVHECYTKAMEIRRSKGERIGLEEIKEMREYEFKIYRSADLVLTLTEEDREILLDYEPGLEEKVRVVPHGVDTEFYYPPPGEKTWERRGRNILYVGNFKHYPNVDAVKNFLNRCWSKVLEEVPDAVFYAIGFSPPEELLEMRSSNVIIREGGPSENVRRHYWMSDVFVAPIELGTGFRGKMLEAMACALPIVATRLAVFGINPVHGRDLFIANNYDEFSNYVIILLKDPSLRKKIGLNALALAKKFDHKNAAKKLEKTLIEFHEKMRARGDSNPRPPA